MIEQPKSKKRKAIAIASLFFGLLPWLVWSIIQLGEFYEWLWAFPYPAPVALLLGILAWRKEVKHPEKYGGQRYYVAALILGMWGCFALMLSMMGWFDVNQLTHLFPAA